MTRRLKTADCTCKRLTDDQMIGKKKNEAET
jgi:hypothetical protein